MSANDATIADPGEGQEQGEPEAPGENHDAPERVRGVADAGGVFASMPSDRSANVTRVQQRGSSRRPGLLAARRPRACASGERGSDVLGGVPGPRELRGDRLVREPARISVDVGLELRCRRLRSSVADWFWPGSASIDALPALRRRRPIPR